VPGHEAPIKLGSTAAQPVARAQPMPPGNNPQGKRLEFRCPDSSGKPYLASRPCDGGHRTASRRRSEPLSPVDKDLYGAAADEAATFAGAHSLALVIRRLEEDSRLLTEGGVFTPDLIETLLS